MCRAWNAWTFNVDIIGFGYPVPCYNYIIIIIYTADDAYIYLSFSAILPEHSLVLRVVVVIPSFSFPG